MCCFTVSTHVKICFSSYFTDRMDCGVIVRFLWLIAEENFVKVTLATTHFQEMVFTSSNVKYQ